MFRKNILDFQEFEKNSWLFVDNVSTIDHQSWIFVHVYVVEDGKRC
jgi:hypothetical protein